MSVQTSYPRNAEIAFAGMKVDLGFDRVESFLAEGAIGFGLGVQAGTGDDQVLVSGSVGVFRGVAVHKHTEPSAVGANDAQYLDERTVSVLRQGLIWMPIETSNQGVIAVDDAAFVNVVIGGAELGKVTSVSVANLATNGVVRQVDTTTQLAAIEFNLPNG